MKYFLSSLGGGRIQVRNLRLGVEDDNYSIYHNIQIYWENLTISCPLDYSLYFTLT